MPAQTLFRRASDIRVTPIEHSEVVETRLWIEEHEWLYQLLKSERNVAPTFRFPDLISASVSLVFAGPEPAARIFQFLWQELIQRSASSVRRRESMWRPQYELLLALQRSPANRHPNPKHQLDQLTTACVALVREEPDAMRRILEQARINMGERASRQKHRLPDH